MTEDSVIEMQTKLAHQELAIEELQKALYEQHVTIDRLEKNLKSLTERLEGLTGASTIGPGNQKPPHY